MFSVVNEILYLLGSVKVWDPRQKDKPVANMAPAEGEEGRDCWCVAFGKPLFPLLTVFAHLSVSVLTICIKSTLTHFHCKQDMFN